VSDTLTEPTLDIRETVESIDEPGLEEAVARRVEETSGSDSPVRSDGLVPLYVIRPGIGRGKGKHLYEARMLEEAVDQGRFRGWKMYVDHQAAEAKKASGGLPRSVRDLGGFIKEAWWDSSVPADPEKGHGQGAVVGLAKPTSFMRSLIEDIPEAVGASISAQATGVRPVQRGKDTVWLVEGIRPRGSVDWVTEAGAGGRVVALMESLEESDIARDEEELLMEGMSDPELQEWLQENRPELLEHVIAEADAEGGGGKDEHEELTKKYLPKFKGNREMAAKAAKRELAQEGHEEGGDVPEVTVEALREALESDEGRQLVEEAVNERFGAIVAPRLAELVEAALEDERELTQAEANASAQRQLEVRDLKDIAHAAIRESRLPEPFQAELRESYKIIDGKPTPSLDVIEDVEEDGTVTKTAEDKLRENVEADIAVKKEQFAAARPTRVTGQGETSKPKATEGGTTVQEGAEEGGESRKTTGSQRTDYQLNEAGIEPDADLYAGIVCPYGDRKRTASRSSCSRRGRSSTSSRRRTRRPTSRAGSGVRFAGPSGRATRGSSRSTAATPASRTCRTSGRG
jgi:hypothetical protein